MAEDSKNDVLHVESTAIYRRNVTASVIAAVVIVAVILFAVFFWLRINSGTRGAMREARDIRIALKMKAVEKYGLGGTIYQPTARNGMVKGVEEDVLKMADAEGNIVLQAWDDNNNEPAAFTFQKDRYIIIFKESEDGSAIWDGYYTLKLLEYE